MTAILQPGDHIHLLLPVEYSANADRQKAISQAAFDDMVTSYGRYGVTVSWATTTTAPVPLQVIAVFRTPPAAGSGVTA